MDQPQLLYSKSDDAYHEWKKGKKGNDLSIHTHMQMLESVKQAGKERKCFVMIRSHSPPPAAENASAMVQSLNHGDDFSAHHFVMRSLKYTHIERGITVSP